MKPACRITQQHIRPSCLCRMHCIINHRGRIRAFHTAHDLHTGTMGPFCQLLPCCCPEGIRRCQYHFSALFFQFSCQLTYGRGLSHAVYTDHKYDRLLFFKIVSRFPYLHLLPDAVDQKLLAGRRLFDTVFLYLCPQSLQNGIGGIDTDVSHNQYLFQFFVEILVNHRITVKYRINSMYDIISCLTQTCLQTAEKSFFFSAHCFHGSLLFSLPDCSLIFALSGCACILCIRHPIHCQSDSH